MMLIKMIEVMVREFFLKCHTLLSYKYVHIYPSIKQLSL